jgi:hypothetical protein
MCFGQSMTRKERNSARTTLYRQIELAAERETRPIALLRLAEAWAWVAEPEVPHGESTVIRVSREASAEAEGGDGGDGGE